MGRAARFLSLGPLFGFATTAMGVVSFACYGPTEVTVALSTDLGCSAPIQTALYKGERGQFFPESAAETSTCTEGVPDAQIGTLVFLPSGARDGEVSVKAVLARNKKSPGACEADPTDCIIATRSFAFVEHTSRRVPIRLLKTCLGVKCGAGETCGPAGTCISNRVECTGEACEIDPNNGGKDGGPPINGDGGPLQPDGGGNVDGGADPRCLLPGNKDVLVANVAMPELAASNDTALLWVGPGVNGNTVFSISKAGGSAMGPSPLYVNSNPILALGMNGQQFIVGREPTPFSIKVGTGEVPFGTVANAKRPYALIGSGSLFFGSTDTEIRAYDTANVAQAEFTVKSMAAGVTSFARVGPLMIAGAAGGVYRTGIGATGGGLGSVDFKLVDTSPTMAIVGSSKASVYAAGKSGNMTTLLIEVNAASTRVIDTIEGIPSSLTADPFHVYGTIDNRIVRWGVMGGKSPETVVTEVETIRHIVADDLCLYYWVGSPASDGIGSLKVHSKGPRNATTQ